MTSLSSSNSFAGVLSEEDAASVASLQARAQRCKVRGFHALAWRYSARAADIKNRATLQKIRTGEIEFDEQLYYTEVPDEYPAQDNDGLDLNLRLIAGSPLAEKIIALLEEDAKHASII